MAPRPVPVNTRPRRPPVPLPLAAAALVLAAGGCALFRAPVEHRGNRLEPEQLAQLTPGVSTRQDVQAVLGSPTTVGAFGDDRWYYVSAITHSRAARHQGVEDQRVVAVRFTPQGVLREVAEVPQDGVRPVAMVSRETPVPGNDRTLLQALFGNVGRVGAGSIAGGGLGGGATGAGVVPGGSGGGVPSR